MSKSEYKSNFNSLCCTSDKSLACCSSQFTSPWNVTQVRTWLWVQDSSTPCLHVLFSHGLHMWRSMGFIVYYHKNVPNSHGKCVKNTADYMVFPDLTCFHLGSALHMWSLVILSMWNPYVVLFFFYKEYCRLETNTNILYQGLQVAMKKKLRK